MKSTSPARSLEEVYFGSRPETDGKAVSLLMKDLVANRAKALMAHPQARGNYFTYRESVPILGMRLDELYSEGRFDLDPEAYTDLSYMVSHLGAPEGSIRAMAEAVSHRNAEPYPPDLLLPLRNAAAEIKFGHPRGRDFEVLGVEGAQGGIGYTFLSYLDPGDEVLITDPAYMHFAPGPVSVGAVTKSIALRRENRFRLDPDEVRRHISLRTKLLIVCDPINPFGTVQAREDLLAIARIAREHRVLILNNITHGTHQTDPRARHWPMAALADVEDMSHVLSTTGISKGYALAALRIGFLAGHPDLLKAPSLVKMEVTKIHLNLIAQYGALAALREADYVRQCTEILRRNYAHIKQTVELTDGVTIPVEPEYGFCTIIDVSGTGVTAQEITVGLFRHHCAVIPGDALGEVGATDYLRLNYSQPNLNHLERFRDALPRAIREAREGRYADGVVAFYARVGTERGARIIDKIRERTRVLVPGGAFAASRV